MRANKSVALLAMALGCGLVASIGITQVLARRNSDTTTSGDTETIFVAMKDVPSGEFLTSQALRLEQWPKDKIPAGALSRIEDVEGRRAKAKLYAGEPILENKLFRKGDSSQGADILIPKGYRVVSVKVDNVSGAAGMLLPGSRVDVMVFLTRNSQKDIPETTTRTVLQDVKVFAVNDVVNLDANDKDSTKSITAKTISLLVTPEQGAKVMLASEMGKIKLVMRSPEDDQQMAATQARPNELFDRPLAGERDKETLVEKPTPKPKQGLARGFIDALKASRTKAADQQRPSWTIRILQPDKIDDIVLEASDDPASSGQQHVFWRPPAKAAQAKGADPRAADATAAADAKSAQPPAAETAPEPGPAKQAPDQASQPTQETD